MTKAIVWFRRDLRLQHNPALDWAIRHADDILPVFIYAPEEEAPWSPGAASRWWLHHSLAALEDRLRQFDLQLQYFRGSSREVLQNLATTTQADALVFNRLYEPRLVERDNQVQQSLECQIQVQAFDSSLLFSPGSILNGQGKPYRVYTAFYRTCLQRLNQSYPVKRDSINTHKLKTLNCMISPHANDLGSLALLDTVNWHDKFARYWRPGEQQALNRLEHFLESSVSDYAEQRDIPGLDGTSLLSASLHFGEITPQQILGELIPLLNQHHRQHQQTSIQTFIKQLIWREFAAHSLYHFPTSDSQPLDQRFDTSFWHHHKPGFTCWTKGQTGIPLVDAGMKQLWETGWMHNRVRMVVASLLVKNLGIHWLDGARWFWDTLVDADLANNTLGWQWVAGCGLDAAPYYRIFNPETQAQRFDPRQHYINSWNGIDGHTLTPVVDLRQSRQQALQRYQNHISSKPGTRK